MKNQFQKSLIAAAVLSMLTSGAVFAAGDTGSETDATGVEALQNPNRRSPAADDSDLKERFTAADTDQDGYLSRDESASDQDLLDRWADFDLDQDDRMSADEYDKYGVTVMENPNRTDIEANHLKDRFSATDTDQDGYISRDEGLVNEEMSKRWTDYDSNSDDMMDQDEFARFDEDERAGWQDADSGTVKP